MHSASKLYLCSNEMRIWGVACLEIGLLCRQFDFRSGVEVNQVQGKTI